MAQLDLFDALVVDVIADVIPDVIPSDEPFDVRSWSLAQNPTATRCDQCTNWTRTLTNYWGECSTRKTYEHEYGTCGEFCPSQSSPQGAKNHSDKTLVL